MNAVGTVAPERPYKGLRPFEATAVDALLFFGRDRERELIAANLVASRLTILYGESGVGKSSVLRAGVVQTLRQQARAGAGFAVALYAGWSERDPIEGIVDAARDAVGDLLGHDPGAGTGTLAERLAWLSDLVGGDLYLVLDQVDEYFLYHGAEGGPLLEALPAVVTEPGLRVNVLLGIREESLARLDVFKARIPALFANSLRLERLDREAGRAAIVGPLDAWSQFAGAASVEIEPAVVDVILSSVTVSAGNGNGAATAAIEPPYLQVVMERLWDAERSAGSNVLRLATLEALGGGRRIVSEHLDRALARLGPAEQDTAAAMFSHLVTPSGAKMAYDLADLAGYAAVEESEAQHVADALVEERILRPVNGRTEGTRVEIFHDVLAAAAAEWRRRHDTARALEAERDEARTRHRRLLVVAIVALVALAMMTAVAVYAVAQQHEADSQRAVAASEARVAKAREDAASALLLLPTDPAGALQLAASAAAADPSPRTEDVLREALVDSRQRKVFGTGQAAVRAGTFSADGQLIAIGDAGGRIVVAQRLGKRRAVFHASARGVNAVAFVGGDRFVATASDDGTVTVWDVTQHRAVRTLRDGTPVADLAVSSDGTVLVTGSAGGAVRVWTLPDGALRRVIQFPGPVADVSLDADAARVLAVGGGHARLFDTASGAELASFDRFGSVTSAALKPDGALVATGYPGKHALVRLWRADGTYVTTLFGHKNGIVDLEFDPVDSLLVGASPSGGARVYNVAVREARQFVSPLFGHTNTVTAAAFSPDGKLVVTASTDKTAVVSSVGGLTLMTLVGHTESVIGAAMSRDNRYVLTWSRDGTARVWDWQPDPLVVPVGRLTAAPVAVAFDHSTRATASIDARGVVHVESPTGGARRITHPGRATAVAMSADGTSVATGGQDGLVIVWPRAGGEPLRLTLGRPVRAIRFSADGRSLVAGGLEGRARVWAVDGRLLRTLDARGKTVTAAALDRNGSVVALGDGSGLATLWSTATGKLEHELKGHKADITALAFSPDGRLLASASRDHDARMWDVRTGRRLHLLRRHSSKISDVAFSADGRWVVTTGPQRVGLWWTTATRVPIVWLQGSIVLLHGRPQPRFVGAAFEPNSRVIRTVDSTGTVAEYSCRVCGGIPELRQLADARLREVPPAARR